MTNPLTPPMPEGTIAWWFNLALWLAGIANFCILAAGLQVPARLNWKEELPRLSPFNQKLMRVYMLFIGLTIVCFGIFTLVFHNALLRGDPIALTVAGFMGFWWILRIAIDAVYYNHNDWPKGPGFVAGHFLLTSTFVALAFTYTALIVWHFV